MAGQLTADVVVARAVAPMDKLAGLALGLVKPGGLVLAIKGASAEDEVSRARSELRRLGARDVEVMSAGSGKVDPAATVVRFTAGEQRSRSGRSAGDAQRSNGPARVGRGVSVTRRSPAGRGRRGTG
jgi:16S rRNA (guanine527-N7)-methyltransferase